MADREMWAVRDAKGEIINLFDSKGEAEREMDALENEKRIEKPMSVGIEMVPREADCDWSPRTKRTPGRPRKRGRRSDSSIG